MRSRREFWGRWAGIGGSADWTSANDGDDLSLSERCSGDSTARWRQAEGRFVPFP